MECACLLLPLVLALVVSYGAGDNQFTYSGFIGSNLTIDGTATVTPNGLLQLTNGMGQAKGHAFYPAPWRFHNTSSNNTVQSFSVTFVFGIITDGSSPSNDGMAFFIASSKNFSDDAFPAQFLGLLNPQNHSDAKNHLFAVELDTVSNVEFEDINDNHVGININSLHSNISFVPQFYDSNSGQLQELSLSSQKLMQVWVDYDGDTNNIDVAIAPLGMGKPMYPPRTTTYNLSTVLTETTYLGFSAASSNFGGTEHYVAGWSFRIGGPAPTINTMLPQLPRINPKSHPMPLSVQIVSGIADTLFFLALGTIACYVVRRRLLNADLLEEWEIEFGPHRFSFKDLFQATEGFKNKHLVGRGGFGQVYKGILPASKTEVAVKRVSHESRQGMKEFIAEVVSIGRLRHRNIVQLLGYCRRKGELILVYEYMPNGSLDKYLYTSDDRPCVGWHQRFQIIKGIAAGRLYIHEFWEQVAIHRDIKSSNVLLDKDMNGRLGDFGLARLYNHGTDPHTICLAGTFGYIAPELARTGKASPLTDVFAFGILLLEVTCGRRPIEGRAQDTPFILVDWVTKHWQNGSLMAAVDSRLQSEYNMDEACLSLKLGLWCSHQLSNARPSMQQVMLYLEGDLPVPEFIQMDVESKEGFDAHIISHQSDIGIMSGLSGGR